MLTIKRPKPHKKLGLAAAAVLIGFGGMYSVLALSGYGITSDGVVLSATDDQRAASVSSKNNSEDTDKKVAKSDSQRTSSTSTTTPAVSPAPVAPSYSSTNQSSSDQQTTAGTNTDKSSSSAEPNSTPAPQPTNDEPGRGAGETTDPDCGIVGCILQPLQPLLNIPSITIGNL